MVNPVCMCPACYYVYSGIPTRHGFNIASLPWKCIHSESHNKTVLSELSSPKAVQTWEQRTYIVTCMCYFIRNRSRMYMLIMVSFLRI